MIEDWRREWDSNVVFVLPANNLLILQRTFRQKRNKSYPYQFTASRSASEVAGRGIGRRSRRGIRWSRADHFGLPGATRAGVPRGCKYHGPPEHRKPAPSPNQSHPLTSCDGTRVPPQGYPEGILGSFEARTRLKQGLESGLRY